MRTALLIAIPRKGPFQILAGPEVALDQQIAGFKELAANRENAKFAELQLWVSDTGITKRMKFRDPKVEKKSEAAATAAEEAEKQRAADEAKAKADQLAAEKAAQQADEKAQQEKFESDRKAKADKAAAEAKSKPKK